MVLAVVGNDRQDRSEYLVLGEFGAIVDVGEDGGLNEPSLCEARRGAPSGGERGTVGVRSADVAQNSLLMFLRDHGTAGDVAVEGIAYYETLREPNGGFDDFVVA